MTAFQLSRQYGLHLVRRADKRRSMLQNQAQKAAIGSRSLQNTASASGNDSDSESGSDGSGGKVDLANLQQLRARNSFVLQKRILPPVTLGRGRS